MGMTEKNVANSFLRAVQCFRRTLRKIVRQGVADDTQVEGELRDLKRFMEGNGL